MYVNIDEEGNVVRSGDLPKAVVLPDGRSISGFDKLDGESLIEAGWIPATDPGPPAHDENTQRVSPSGWAVENNHATRTWVVEDIPAEELAAREALITREADAQTGLDRIAEMPNVREKLRAVVAGNDTLTAAQIQRLLAAVALDALKDRTDV